MDLHTCIPCPLSETGDSPGYAARAPESHPGQTPVPASPGANEHSTTKGHFAPRVCNTYLPPHPHPPTSCCLHNIAGQVHTAHSPADEGVPRSTDWTVPVKTGRVRCCQMGRADMIGCCLARTYAGASVATSATHEAAIRLRPLGFLVRLGPPQPEGRHTALPVDDDAAHCGLRSLRLVRLTMWRK